MATDLKCWRCGVALVGIIEPLSRREVCRACDAEIHACRMCRSYDSHVSGQCREDRAEPPNDRESANFCDYFAANPAAYQPQRQALRDRAYAQAAALFGDTPPVKDAGDIDEPDRALRQLFGLDSDDKA